MKFNPIKRPQYLDLAEDLLSSKSMIFLAGPRQSGKTTLTQEISKGYSNQLYFNWDLLNDRQKWLKDPYFFTQLCEKR